MGWKEDWDSFLTKYIAGGKDKVFLDKFDVPLEELNYEILGEMILPILELPYSKTTSLLRFLAKYLYKDVILAILINIIFSGNAKVEEYLLSEIFPSEGLSAFPRLVNLGNHFSNELFWQKIERYLDFFGFYGKINSFFKWNDKIIDRYLIKQLSKVLTSRTQHLLFSLLEQKKDSIVIKAVLVALRNFPNKATAEKLLEFYKEEEENSFNREIESILRTFPDNEMFGFYVYLEGKDISSLKKKLLINILLEKAREKGNFQSLLLLSLYFNSEIKKYFYKRFSEILNDILHEFSRRYSEEELKKFYNENYYIVDFILFNISKLKDIDYLSLLDLVLRFSIVLDNFEEIYQSLPELAKSELIKALCKKEKLDLLLKLSKELVYSRDLKMLQELIDYLSEKLNKDSVKLLVKLILHPSDDIKKKILSVLEKDEVQEKLDLFLGDLDPNIRLSVIKILINRKDPGAFDKLLKVTKDPDPLVRKEALKALYEVNKEKAYEYLLESLKDSDDKIVLTSMKYLKTYDNINTSIYIFSNLLFYPSQRVKLEAAKEFVKRQWQEYTLKGRCENESTLKMGLLKSFQITPKAFDFLKSYFQDENPQIRKKAVSFLAYFINEDVFNYFKENLRRCLVDPDLEVVKSAIPLFRWTTEFSVMKEIYFLLKKPYRLDVLEEILGLTVEWKNKYKNKFVVFLHKLWKSEANDDVFFRSYMMVVFLRIGENKFFHTLIKQILSENYLERSATIEAFGAIASKDKMKIVFSALQDSSPEVRYSALKVLLYLKNKKILGREVYDNFKYIKSLLNDKDKRIRDISEKLLS